MTANLRSDGLLQDAHITHTGSQNEFSIINKISQINFLTKFFNAHIAIYVMNPVISQGTSARNKF